MYHFCMILRFACQGSITPRMGTYDRLIFWTILEVFPMEVRFHVAMAIERSQTLHCRQFLVAKVENTLGGFGFKRDGFRKS
jgi:hypothetical protein